MSGSKLLGGMQLAAASAPLVAGYFAKRDQDDLARQAKNYQILKFFKDFERDFKLNLFHSDFI